MLPALLTLTQVTMFVNDTTVTKGMVKYASQITRESIVDIEGKIHCPEAPIASCSQSQVGGVACITTLNAAYNTPLQRVQ